MENNEFKLYESRKKFVVATKLETGEWNVTHPTGETETMDNTTFHDNYIEVSIDIQ